MNAVEGTVARCKLSVIAQATASVEECVAPDTLKPYAEHFHPDLMYNPGSFPTNPRSGYLEPRKVGTPHMAIRVLPLKNQVRRISIRNRQGNHTFFFQHIARGDLDLWDFVLRKLFVLKATSVENCLKSKYIFVCLFAIRKDPLTSQLSLLGPGSTNLISKLTDPSRNPEFTFDPRKFGPRDLNLRQWAVLLEEFKKWPFRPDVLFLLFHIARYIY